MAATKSIPTFLNQHRRFGKVDPVNSDRTALEQAPDADKQDSCDAAFLNCLKNQQCTACFASLQSEGIDWASVTPETPCTDVMTFLFSGGHCSILKGNQPAIDAFCSTFDSCVIWDDDNGSSKKGQNETGIDCDKLTECNWPGFHSSFIGDGVCHGAMNACYNSKICSYDGGDCCEDTCKDTNNRYTHCGIDGYVCKDPDSVDCDPWLSDACPEDVNDDDWYDPSTNCGVNQVPYRLVMYDR